MELFLLIFILIFTHNNCSKMQKYGTISLLHKSTKVCTVFVKLFLLIFIAVRRKSMELFFTHNNYSKIQKYGTIFTLSYCIKIQKYVL